jgi:hypothetical protein
MPRWVVGIVLLGLGCGAMSLARRVSERGFALVQEGRYAGSVRIKNGDPVLEKLVRGWRDELESDPGIMSRAAGKFFVLPDSCPFHYMYVAEDSAQGKVLLRYFAYDPKPVIMAGWQLLFVFDRRARRLDRVYASEVPLE